MKWWNCQAGVFLNEYANSYWNVLTNIRPKLLVVNVSINKLPIRTQRISMPFFQHSNPYLPGSPAHIPCWEAWCYGKSLIHLDFFKLVLNVRIPLQYILFDRSEFIYFTLLIKYEVWYYTSSYVVTWGLSLHGCCHPAARTPDSCRDLTRLKLNSSGLSLMF